MTLCVRYDSVYVMCVFVNTVKKTGQQVLYTKLLMSCAATVVGLKYTCTASCPRP